MAISLLFSEPLTAAEVDSYAARLHNFTDSKKQVNQIINQLIRKAIKRSNLGGTCDRQYFRESLLDEGGSLFDPKFGMLVITNPNTGWFSVKCENSIYSDIAVFDFLSCALPSAPVLRFEDTYFGLDKLAHFWAMGYKYFEERHLKKHSLENVLMYGEDTENSYLGAWPTGVYSYADLAANYEGLLFWERIVGLEQGTQQVEPYVSCEQNKWQLREMVDMGDYVNTAWDEAINLSLYVSDKIYRKVRHAADSLGAEFKQSKAKHCIALSQKYGDVGKSILSKECLENRTKKDLNFGFMTRWSNGVTVNLALLSNWTIYNMPFSLYCWFGLFLIVILVWRKRKLVLPTR